MPKYFWEFDRLLELAAMHDCPQGLKPDYISRFTARLKLCPDATRVRKKKQIPRRMARLRWVNSSE